MSNATSIRVLVVDDEKAAQELLRKKLNHLRSDLEIKVIGDSVQAYDVILSWRPALVFLDIQMPVLNGFQLLAQIPKEVRDFSLVFCTAYSEFAVQAFEEAAVDYLLKPVDELRLKEALDRALAKVRSRWQNLVDQRQTQESFSKILVRHRGKLQLIPLSEILFFTSEAHETVVITNAQQEFICDLSLDRLEEQLKSEAFDRCHRSFLVNLARVASFDPQKNQIHFEQSDRYAEVSKRKRPQFSKKFKASGTTKK